MEFTWVAVSGAFLLASFVKGTTGMGFPLIATPMVAMEVDTPMTLIARSDFPAKDVNEFVAYVKANKAKLNLAHAGIGSASHLCGLLFQSTIQTEVTTIPFKGTADALAALLAKQIDFLCDQSTNTTQHINAGQRKYGLWPEEVSINCGSMPVQKLSGSSFSVADWA